MSVVRLKNISHWYPNGTRALSQVSLTLDPQRFTVLIGPSGAGKSTLMRVINGLVRPAQGEVWLDDQPLHDAPPAVVRQARCKVAMVFQQFNLVKRATALENVLMGRLGATHPVLSSLGLYSQADRALAFALLERVGLADLAWQRADTLSGGQQQRVAIARALAQKPYLILADEPISALDPRSSEQVMDLLHSIHRQDGIAVVCNLHHLETVRDYADWVVALKQGAKIFEGEVASLTDEVVRGLYYDLPLEGSGIAAVPPFSAVVPEGSGL